MCRMPLDNIVLCFAHLDRMHFVPMTPDRHICSGFYDALAFLLRHQLSLESQYVLCEARLIRKLGFVPPSFMGPQCRGRGRPRSAHLLHWVLRGIDSTTGTHAFESRQLGWLARGCFSQHRLRCDGWHGRLTKGSVGDDAWKKRGAV